jgi:hypothetical protein
MFRHHEVAKLDHVDSIKSKHPRGNDRQRSNQVRPTGPIGAIVSMRGSRSGITDIRRLPQQKSNVGLYQNCRSLPQENQVDLAIGIWPGSWTFSRYRHASDQNNAEESILLTRLCPHKLDLIHYNQSSYGAVFATFCFRALHICKKVCPTSGMSPAL